MNVGHKCNLPQHKATDDVYLLFGNCVDYLLFKLADEGVYCTNRTDLEPQNRWSSPIYQFS